jgi:hypothetical protein
MEESIVNKLRALARPLAWTFPPVPVPVENTSADYRDDLVGSSRRRGWIHAVLRSVEKDRQLYDWAAARMEQSC